MRTNLRSHPHRFLGRGATDGEIELAEQALGILLPSSYKSFLRDFGWGGVGHWELFGVGTGVPSEVDLVDIALSERTEATPLTPEHLVPVMNDGGGNLFCLDTARTLDDDCPVVLHDHELDEISDVSDSFLAWLNERIAGTA